MHFKQINVPYGVTLIVDEIFIGLANALCEESTFISSAKSASPLSWTISMATYSMIAVGAIVCL
jgi:hypothetical protein